MTNIPELFVPFFTSKEKLDEGVLHLCILPDNIKQVDDPNEAVASIREQGCRVMVDPYIHNGKTRWTELFRENEQDEFTQKEEYKRRNP
jgi:hypothetical protein